MTKLRLALPNKGRMADELATLFDDAGLAIRRPGGDRALVAPINDDFEAIFVRSQDIAEFVADGVADAGVTGWDLICESGAQLDCLLDLELAKCRLALATSDTSEIRSLADIGPGTRVATSFPNLARIFFSQIPLDIEIAPISGAAEIAPRLGLAELVLDLVSTGSTMQLNQLRELATVLESSARLVSRERSPELDNLVLALSSVLSARGRRYLMANVTRDQLDEACKLLPGISGPTVMNILNHDDLVAVHAVVEQSEVYSTVSCLKALGAQGIVITRLERLVL